MDFRVYIPYSAVLDRYYVGYTSTGIDVRLRKHNAQHRGFTGKAPDWAVVYQESFRVKSEATKREREIKGWKSRKMIEKLIQKE